MNELQVFNNEEFGAVRMVILQDKPYFMASEIAEKLGYANPSKATNDHCKHIREWWGNDSLGRRQRFKVIPESDVYRLVIRSKLPSAERFEKWVMEEVLPSIRKNGGYIAGQETLSDDELLAKALLVAQNKIAERDALIQKQREKIEADKPKVLFSNAVAASKSSILVGELAKLIAQNGHQIGQKRLFQWMRDKGYLLRSGASYNMPAQRYIEQGLFEIKESAIQNPDGSVRLTKTTKVTGKGQVYFINKFLGGQAV